MHSTGKIDQQRVQCTDGQQSNGLTDGLSSEQAGSGRSIDLRMDESMDGKEDGG